MKDLMIGGALLACMVAIVYTIEHWTDLDPGITDGIDELERDIDHTAERLEKDIEDKRHGR